MNYPKDQPWAWKCVVGGFLVYFQLAGIMSTYSIIYDDVKTFYSVKASTASLLFGVLIGLRFILGPLAVMLINRLGCDVVTVIGGCLTSLGLFIASCSSNIVLFLLGYGLLVGVGLGMSCNSMAVIVSELFDKRKSVAFSVTLVGFPLGYVINPHIFTFFYFQYGFRSAIMLLSASSLHTVIAGLLFIIPKRVRISNKEQPLLTNEKQLSRDQKFQRAFQFIQDFHFNIEPLRNENFVIYIIAVSLYALGSIPWLLYIVDIIHSHGEISLNVAIQTLTIDGITQIFSRIPAGLVFDKIRKYRGIVVSLCCFLSSIVYSVLVTMTPSINSYLIISIFRGIFVSNFFSQYVVLLGDICSPELLPISIGIMSFFAGLGTIIGPIISGLIRDRFSSYLETFLFLSANQFLAGTLILFVFARKLVRDHHGWSQ